MGAFEELFKVNVNGHTEKKKTGNAELTYLSWPFAWAEVKKRYPDAHYEIEKFNGLPYVYDPATGYMVYTTVTIEGITHEMWLPVMDGANNAMKAEPYTYSVKEYKYGKWTGNYVDKTVAAATMMEINRAIMRCLVKNLAMFGLGLYIYAGEDLPITEEDDEKPKKKTSAEAAKDSYPDRETMCRVIEKVHGGNARFAEYLKSKGAKSVSDLSDAALMATYSSISEQEVRNAIEGGVDE